jgi:hypothetical protein
MMITSDMKITAKSIVSHLGIRFNGCSLTLELSTFHMWVRKRANCYELFHSLQGERDLSLYLPPTRPRWL